MLIPWGRADKYEGKLACPYGYGVVLANITRAQLDKAFQLDAQELLLPPHLVICQDEMTDKAEAEPFQEKLWCMFNYDFPQKLTLPQIDRISWSGEDYGCAARAVSSQYGIWPSSDSWGGRFG